jgi:hypothetical protein
VSISLSGVGTQYAVYANTFSYLNVNSLTAATAYTATNWATVPGSTPLGSQAGQMAMAAVGYVNTTARTGQAAVAVSGTSRANVSQTGSSGTTFLGAAVQDTPISTGGGSLTSSSANTNSTAAQASVTLYPCMGSAPSSVNSPNLTPNVPWVALSGQAPPLVINPVVTEYAKAGTYVYTIPSWMAAGYYIDIVCLGAGGGGGMYTDSEPAPGYYQYGYGGRAGSYANITLVYGVDIPVTTNTISVTVGAGGAGGSGAVGTPAAGGASSVTITGYGGGPISGAGGGAGGYTGNQYNGAPGGYAAWSQTYTGQATPGETFNTAVYPAGVGSNVLSTAGVQTPTLGSGGYGGWYSYYPGYWQYIYYGGPGAAGAVWITAYTTQGAP